MTYDKTARNFNPVIATASTITIAEVDEVVEVGEIPPDDIVTPHLYVDVIVESQYIKNGGVYYHEEELSSTK